MSITIELCRCGHAVSSHQDGDGPWTGWCYGDSDCGCEAPEPEAVVDDASEEVAS